MQYLLIDIMAVAILAFFIWRGWRKGLLLSLCGLVVILVAYLGAGFVADTLDDPVADAIAPKLEEAIQTALEDKAGQLTAEGALPSDRVTEALRDMGGLYAWAAEQAEDALGSALTETISQQAASAALAVAKALANRILFIAAFLLLFILLTLLLHALNLVARLPGLHMFNGLGGGVIGLFKGVVVIWVALLCLQVFDVLSSETLGRTYLLQFFTQWVPDLSLPQV